MKIRRKETSAAVPDGDLLVIDEAEAEETTKADPEAATEPVREAPAAATQAEPSRPARPRGLLGEVLVKRGLVTDAQVAQALKQQAGSGKRLGEVLVDMGALDERGLVDALADFFGLPVTDLRRHTPFPEAIALIPEEIAREHLVIPVHLDGDGLHVAVAQPSDDLRFLLAETSGHSVRLTLAPMTDIKWAIDRSYQAIDSVDKLVQAFDAVEGTRKRVAETETTPVVTENAPVVQVVDNILTQAVRDRASDVHIEPSQDVIYVRFRIDGALKDVLELPVSMGVGLVSRIKIMANINIVEKRRSQDGQFTTTIDGKDTDVRVATVATIWGEKC
ncbi:MAG TPA: ATPase, T2SS/T4P/T4SS family, partial [Acidimicrobiales bacterium]|nr:ATPase, T2SS/T4P/T4SS family [Acidimicrobiales bacterium]